MTVYHTRRDFVKGLFLAVPAVLGWRLGAERALAQSGVVVAPSLAEGVTNRVRAKPQKQTDPGLRTPSRSTSRTNKPGVSILPRAAWTDQEANALRLRKATPFTRITVHHAGSEACSETDRQAVINRLEGVWAGHVKRNYGDIGYHFVLDYAGRVWEGRSLEYEGAHVAAMNPGNIGIMLLGNFEKQQPSKGQLVSLPALVATLRRRYAIRPSRIYGHRDLGHSLCPGRYLYPHVIKMRS